MRTLYVVRGSTGEYSDRSEWNVRAFLTLAKAQQHVVLATARANELRAAGHNRFGDSGCWCDDCDDRPTRRLQRPFNEFDERMRMDYNGTRYAISEVPLDDDVLLDIADTVGKDVAAGRLRRALDLRH